MTLQLVEILAPVFIAAFVGFLWVRLGGRHDTSLITSLTSNIGTPCLIFATLLGTSTAADNFAEVAGMAGLAIATFMVIGAIVLTLARLPFHTFLPALTFGNAGNLGLPLCLFAFGQEGLAMAIAFFTVSAIANFTIGNWVASGSLSPRELLKTPIIYAVGAAILVLQLNLPVPLWLTNTTSLLGGLTIPLMLLALGMSLADFKLDRLGRASLLSVLRLAMGASVGFALAWFFGLEGTLRGVIIIQCAMPVAVFNFLFAAKHGREADAVAAMVLVSTLLAFAVLPALLMAVL